MTTQQQTRFMSSGGTAPVSDFEQKLRTAIVESATALAGSGLRFAIFRNARCNTDYWTLSGNGGWKLRQGVPPADAVRDIYSNRTDAYATECATAMMIVYYRAVLEVYGDELFNKTFSDNIYLMDWDIRDPLLRNVGKMSELRGAPLIAGDRAYFANPDHSPDLPQWQGENVIVLGDDRYYGHGIGIANAQQILNSLNSKRKSADSRPAYLLDKAARPEFAKLAKIMYTQTGVVWREFAPAIAAAAIESRSGFV